MLARTYDTFKLAYQDLAYMIATYGKPNGKSKEGTNYFYQVTSPKKKSLTPHQPWANLEFKERISGKPLNPGKAWKAQAAKWEPLLESQKIGNGLIQQAFSYTYSERISYQMDNILEELGNNLESGEAFISIWDPYADTQRLSRRRVPTVLGYQFLLRSHKLEMTCLQRECDLYNDYQDDVYLAFRLQKYLAKELGIPTGNFYHWIGSLFTLAVPPEEKRG